MGGVHARMGGLVCVFVVCLLGIFVFGVEFINGNNGQGFMIFYLW